MGHSKDKTRRMKGKISSVDGKRERQLAAPPCKRRSGCSWFPRHLRTALDLNQISKIESTSILVPAISHALRTRPRAISHVRYWAMHPPIGSEHIGLLASDGGNNIPRERWRPLCHNQQDHRRELTFASTSFRSSTRLDRLVALMFSQNPSGVGGITSAWPAVPFLVLQPRCSISHCSTSRRGLL
jgi:hypothetical protein